MRGNQKNKQMVYQTAEQSTVDPYHRRATKFYNGKHSGQSAAVVETVFRKPKAYANLYEYDNTETVDQVPTAIGFNSFDSADEVVEAQMKSRYYFEEQETEKEPAKDTEVKPEKVKAGALNKNNGGESKSLALEPFPILNVKLRKVKDTAAKATPHEEPKGKTNEEQNVKARDEAIEKTLEILKAQTSKEKSISDPKISVGDKEDPEEREGDAAVRVDNNDRYGLGQSVSSDDDSCPPLWKSFSDDYSGKTEKDRGMTREKERLETALNKAKRLHALNSVRRIDDSTPYEIDMGVDPRLRRNANAVSASKQSWSMGQMRSSANGNNSNASTKSRQKTIQNTVPRANKRKDPVSVVTNSIIASQQSPQRIEVKKMIFDKRFDDASYGSEGQSKGSDDDQLLAMETTKNAEPEQTFAEYMYESLMNLTNMNYEYWVSEETNGRGSQQGLDAKDQRQNIGKLSTNIKANRTTKRDPRTSKSNPTIVSEITIPTPAVLQNGEELGIEDTISILGLDKQGNREAVEKGENRVPQKEKKRKGKSRVFGRIIGRKTAA